MESERERERGGSVKHAGSISADNNKKRTRSELSISDFT